MILLGARPCLTPFIDPRHADVPTSSTRPMSCHVCRLVTDGPHTIWLDNFCKPRSIQMPNIKQSTWQPCLWTGRAYRQFRGELSMDLMYKPDESVIPAMPDDLFAYLPHLVTLFKEQVPCTPASKFLRRTSMVVALEITTVPMKPSVDLLTRDLHRRAILEQHDGLQTLYADKIIDLNIESRDGFARLIRDHFEEKEQNQPGKCKKYSAFNFDINIFEFGLNVYTHAQTIYHTIDNTDNHLLDTSLLLILHGS